MEFREQLQMTKQRPAIHRPRWQCGDRIVYSEQISGERPHKGFGWVIGGDAPRCARIKPDSSQCYPSDNNVGTGR